NLQSLASPRRSRRCAPPPSFRGRRHRSSRGHRPCAPIPAVDSAPAVLSPSSSRRRQRRRLRLPSVPATVASAPFGPSDGSQSTLQVLSWLLKISAAVAQAAAALLRGLSGGCCWLPSSIPYCSHPTRLISFICRCV
ncbi:Os11g0373711, partial [Oryza sativa Japonica Group]